MPTIDDSEYISFRRNLRYIMDDTDLTSKKQLGFLMTQRSFRINKKHERLWVSEKQLNVAWDYVTGHREWIDFNKIKYKEELYGSFKKKRALTSITYKKKTYRKGQFLPREYEE